MKKSYFLLFAIFILVGAGCGGNPENDQEIVIDDANSRTIIDAKTVFDYYKIIPEEYLDYEYFDHDIRMDHIALLDEENYYIKIEDKIQPPGEEHGTVAVFIKPDGSHVIAIEGGICTSLCFRNLTLLEFENEKWEDVTDDLLAMDQVDLDAIQKEVHAGSDLEAEGIGSEIRSFHFELPRIGTDLILYEYISKKPVLTFKWENGRFVQQ